MLRIKRDNIERYAHYNRYGGGWFKDDVLYCLKSEYYNNKTIFFYSQ